MTKVSMIGIEYLSRNPIVGDIVRIALSPTGASETFGDMMRVHDIVWEYAPEADYYDDDGDEVEVSPFIRTISLVPVVTEPVSGHRRRVEPEPETYTLDISGDDILSADTVCLRTESGPYYVNLYLTDREFGGAEEGGWYYSTGHPKDCYRFDSRSEAFGFLHSVKAASLLERHNLGRAPIGSMRCYGVYRFKVEPHMAKAWPVTRPRYS